jgi:hypothetical protein
LGEQAANSARPANGVISIKRLRVGVFIWVFLAWCGLSLGCRSAMARLRTDALTSSDPRRHIACVSGCVSVRWCTQLTEVTDDSECSQPRLLWRTKNISPSQGMSATDLKQLNAMADAARQKTRKGLGVR